MASSGMALGLDAGHKQAVVDYLRFARYKREQRVRAVESAFEDLLESRLVEDNTFTGLEVRDMLQGLQEVLKGDVESELIDSAHTQVLLLRQVFGQAQEWKLQLQPNISELENRKMLEEIAQFEQAEFAELPGAARVEIAKAKKLDPLAADGPAAILHGEIRQLTQENAKLKLQLEELEKKANTNATEKSDLSDTLTQTKDALQKASTSAKTADSDLDALQREVATAQAELAKLKTTSSGADLTSAKDTEEKLKKTLHDLLALRAELTTAKEDLEKKFNSTAAYNNMKKMLTTKNDQIKELRAKLAKYEGDAES